MLTYNHFYQTGIQDCNNGFDPQDFDIYSENLTTHEIVANVVSEWKVEDWYNGNGLVWDDYEGLDPGRCYNEWLKGWRDCAESIIDRLRTERFCGDKDNR